MWHAFTTLLEAGGWVLYPIFSVSVLAAYIISGRFFYYRQLGLSRKRFLAVVGGGSAGAGDLSGPYAKVLGRLAEFSNNPALAKRVTREFLTNLIPTLNTGLSTLGACIVISPLLGLLGTISGMNEMFAVIGEFGFGNPAIMANGISMALQATLTGLAVAVVVLICQDYLNDSKSMLLHKMEKDFKDLVRRAEFFAGNPIQDKRKDHAMQAEYRLLPDDHAAPEINLAPFVDTIMILLIFFVVTANLYVETGVDVSKPKAQSAQASDQKSVLIGLTREGTVHIFGRQVSLDRLKLIVEREAAKQAELAVVIIADREAPTGRTVEVMDQCALGGAQKISIAAGKD